MKTNKIARTAMMFALLIVLQFVTKSFGQIVTGTCVNLILAVTTAICGLEYGVIISLISPFFAYLLGIGPAFIQIVPAIAVGNAAYVLCLHFLTERNKYVIIISSAMVKFITLYGLIVTFILPSLGLPENKAAIISASFSWPQLITATLGGLLSAVVIKAINKNIDK